MNCGHSLKKGTLVVSRGLMFFVGMKQVLTQQLNNWAESAGIHVSKDSVLLRFFYSTP